MKNDVLNEIWTLWIHCYVIWAQECLSHLSKTNQQYIERVSWWLCDHIPEWYIDIFERPWDTLQTCVEGTEKAKRESFVCETVKKQVQNPES